MLKPTPEVKQPDDQGARSLALRSLFDAQEGPLLRYTFSLTGRRVVAEEIVQESFLQLHRHWGKVNEPESWLFRVARNRAFSYLRKNKREVLQGDDRDLLSTDSDNAVPDALLQRAEAIGALRRMVEQLSEPDRTIVKLKYFDNLKYREISDQTGLTVSNVGYRLHHILKDLGEKLRPLGIDE